MTLIPFLELLLALAVILMTAKGAGYLSTRLHHPSILGQLLIGVILGPSLINFLHLLIFSSNFLTETIQEFSKIGVLLLVFVTGLGFHREVVSPGYRVGSSSAVIRAYGLSKQRL